MKFGSFRGVSKGDVAPPKKDRDANLPSVLRRFGAVSHGVRNYIHHANLLFFLTLLAISISFAVFIVPGLTDTAPYVISAENDKCFAKSETVCENEVEWRFHFWNLTNADDVVAGTAPPALVEVGPFAMHKTKAVKSNVTFFDDGNKVSYTEIQYAEYDTANFCDGCSLDDVIVSFNPAYYTLVKMYGSEANFLYTLTPQVLPPILDGLGALLSALAGSPADPSGEISTAVAAGAAAVTTLALKQWGDCSVLGDTILNMGLPAAYTAAFPVAPEFGCYAATYTGMAAGTIGVDATGALAVTTALTADPTGMAVLGVLQTPDATNAANWGISPAVAPLVKAYLVYFNTNYNQPAGATAMGPWLGGSSSGIFIARTVREWLEGYVDPLTSSVYAASDPRRLVRTVHGVYPLSDLDTGSSVDRYQDVVTHVTDKSEWRGVGATPWVVATGKDDPDKVWDVLASTKGDAQGGSYAYNTGHVEAVGGKHFWQAIYPKVANKGTGLGSLGEVTTWFDIGAGLDMGRKVKLQYRGDYDLPHKKNTMVRLYNYEFVDKELHACPMNVANCDYDVKFQGAWDVSDHTAIETVVTMPHAYNADTRLFGYIDPTSASCPFQPNKTAHDFEWEILKFTGNVMGASARYQMNWQVKPTDVYYPNLWQPVAGSSLDGDATDGIYVPGSWSSASYRVAHSVIEDIVNDVAYVMGALAMFYVFLPVGCLIFIVIAIVSLYVRSRVRNARQKIIDEHKRAERERHSLIALNGGGKAGFQRDPDDNNGNGHVSGVRNESAYEPPPTAFTDEDAHEERIRSGFWAPSAPPKGEDAAKDADARGDAVDDDDDVTTVVVDVEAPALKTDKA